jgi:DNA-binding MarR family transcriptional regulator
MHERMRRQAIELLNHLRKVGKINQKQIADFLNVTMATAGRIVGRLDYRYIERERGKGREWLISLKV